MSLNSYKIWLSGSTPVPPTTRSPATSGAAISIGGYAGGAVVALVVVGIFCFVSFFVIRSRNVRYRNTSRHVSVPPRTVVVACTTSPRPTAPPLPRSAVVFMAVKKEVVVMKAKETAHPQAQTHAGEAPPDYNSAVNYPNTTY